MPTIADNPSGLAIGTKTDNGRYEVKRTGVSGAGALAWGFVTISAQTARVRHYVSISLMLAETDLREGDESIVDIFPQQQYIYDSMQWVKRESPIPVFDWKQANTTQAVQCDDYLDITAGGITITLPPVSTEDCEIFMRDGVDWSVNNINVVVANLATETIGNGQSIEGGATLTGITNFLLDFNLSAGLYINFHRYANQLNWIIRLDTQHPDPIKHNFSATVDPTVSNDSSENYTESSHWFNLGTGTMWILRDSSVGAAIWVESNKRELFETTTDGQTLEWGKRYVLKPTANYTFPTVTETAQSNEILAVPENLDWNQFTGTWNGTGTDIIGNGQMASIQATSETLRFLGVFGTPSNIVVHA